MLGHSVRQRLYADVELYPLRRVAGATQNVEACTFKPRQATRSVWATLILCMLPAGLVLVTILAAGDHELPPELRRVWEHVAGGLMLCTYMYALFRNEDFVRVQSVGTNTAIPCEPLWSRAFSVMLGFTAGVLLLDSLGGDDTPNMAPYALGFVTDGLTVAMVVTTSTPPTNWYNIRGQGALPSLGEAILAVLFSMDNLVTGMGLSSIVATVPPGRTAWAFIFFCCPIVGGLFGFTLRKILDGLKAACLTDWKDNHPADLFELFVKSFFAVSILDGSLEFLTQGLTLAALVGVLIGWVLLLASDKLEAVKYSLVCCGGSIPLYTE